MNCFRDMDCSSGPSVDILDAESKIGTSSILPTYDFLSPISGSELHLEIGVMFTLLFSFPQNEHNMFNLSIGK